MGPSLNSAGKCGQAPSWAASLGTVLFLIPLRYDRQAMLPTIEWTDDAIVMIDQRKLPAEEIYVRCRTAQEVAKAIKTMVIRGAPAIGVAAAMGLALCIRQSKATGTQKLAVEFY